MISAVSHVSLNVADQDRAKEFWTETMGFECLTDTPMGEPGSPRWIEVVPPDRNITLILFAHTFDEKRVGVLNDTLFTCEDIHRTYEELTARGVEFTDAPRQEYWGWWATFKDPAGNLYGLGQREPA